MARLKFAGNILNAETFVGKEDDEMVEHVGALVDETVVGSIGGFDDGLKGFLAYLLRHTVQSVLEKTGGVAALGHLLMTFLYEVLKL